MSTNLTTSSHGFDLPESRSLHLVRQLAGFQTEILSWLIGQLHKDGFASLTISQLTFLGELACGINHASELARRLGVSRQAIHKSVRDLSIVGWLETRDHPEQGNQKIILFTSEGERLMSHARQHFAALDARLEGQFGAELLDKVGVVLASRDF